MRERKPTQFYLPGKFLFIVVWYQNKNNESLPLCAKTLTDHLIWMNLNICTPFIFHANNIRFVFVNVQFHFLSERDEFLLQFYVVAKTKNNCKLIRKFA